MQAHNKTIVLKFGSSVLSSREALPDAVSEIYRWYRDGHRVVAVVSAIGDTTDALIAQASQFGDSPCRHSSAMLFATGELTSAALLGLALDQAGVPASVLDHRQIGLAATGDPHNATPIDLDVEAVGRALADAPVLVIPGFLGVDEVGRTTLLGRGGSDLSAIFVAQRIAAERCRLIKDVDGLYESDPNTPGTHPRRYQQVTFEDALALDGRILQPKATRFAQRNRLPFEVGCVHEHQTTLVGAATTQLERGIGQPAPLRIALLGLGNVGRGVYDRIASRPDLFEVVCVAVRSLDGPERSDVPREILTTDPWRALRSRPDAVIELIGGFEPAAELIEGSLARGIHVITANKAVLARSSERLHDIARSRGVTLQSAASVGGSAPVLERAAQLRTVSPVTSITGILNGSANAILDDLTCGKTLADAIHSAQQAGFCEADPTRDLDGHDAADKLAVLARVCFDAPCEPDDIPRVSIGELAARDQHRLKTGQQLRQVAACNCSDGRVHASIQLRSCDPSDALSHVRGEWNAVQLTLEDGSVHVIRGRGAGRIPTTLAVLADLFEVRRTLQQNRCGAVSQPAHA